MASVSIVEPAVFDFDSLVNLQRAAFGDEVTGGAFGYIFCREYYKWKYDTPAGAAKIAVLEDEEGLISASSVFPLDMKMCGAHLKGWQACDIATHPRALRRKYFSKCLLALSEVTKQSDLLFVFPNKHSSPGFEINRFQYVTDLPTWMRILPGRCIDSFPAVSRLAAFDEKCISFFMNLDSTGTTMVARSMAYLDWRYIRHPLHKYEIFRWSECGQVLGVVVLRRLNIFNRSFAIVMEIHCETEHVERGLLAFAAAWGSENKVYCTLVITNTTKSFNGLCAAYIPIPLLLLPRRQKVMIFPNCVGVVSLANSRWNVQIGDWDGF